MIGHLPWYLARSSGFLAYGCAWGTVVWGLLLTTRLAPRLDRSVTYLVHRLLGMGSALFLGIHLVTLYLDPWAHFSLRDLLVPFAASYRPLWLACGIFGAYLLGAIVLTSLMKARLRFAWWLGIHYLAYPTVALGLVHGLGSGSDTGQPWARAVYAASAAILAVLWVVRIGWGRQVTRGSAGRPRPVAARYLDPATLALGHQHREGDEPPWSRTSACWTAATRDLRSGKPAGATDRYRAERACGPARDASASGCCADAGRIVRPEANSAPSP